jgi:catechol 2,3-dioxygenase-like lactoylglutathione lyase family enzyme
MIDHIGLSVSDYGRSKAFYIKALEPLGYQMLIEVQGFAGFGLGKNGGPIASFWIHEDKSKVVPGAHVAFAASDRKSVDAFYEAAIKAKGTDNGKPGLREMYHPHYYGAFVLDPDGYNIEAVCHQAE